MNTLTEQSCEVIYSQAYYLYQNGKWKEAIPFFQILTLQQSDDKRHWTGLGACYQMTNNDNEALRCYGMATCLHPDDAMLHLLSAECFFRLNERKSALDALSTARATLKSNPNPEASKKLVLLKKLWKQ
ncbi:MAG: hypothetical protein WD595_06420 [Waddliaceae bacterium]